MTARTFRYIFKYWPEPIRTAFMKNINVEIQCLPPHNSLESFNKKFTLITPFNTINIYRITICCLGYYFSYQKTTLFDKHH